ncbi:MAG: M20/M25/M40 family metallo-hydrolase [Gammaproteobacteria bacterium]|nr:M20/M25/M40 family metallo-hydrolase [Gammaproteobacteria bacterium]
MSTGFMGHRLACLVISASALANSTGVVAELSNHEMLARDIFRELIEINTTDSVGDNTAAAEAMATRLLGAGFPESDIHILSPAPRKGNLVFRLRSPAPALKPILLLAHLDVVEAEPDDWSIPPFEFLERDGYYYGRGTTDDKAMCAIWMANMIRLKQQGYRPNRDIIVALTADEEGGPNNGVTYLLAEHFELIEAAFVLNEGGGGAMQDGKRIANSVQAAEKVYQSYELSVTNPGGHSSLPRSDNAIYQLAKALIRISEHQFPIELNEVTRAWVRQGFSALPARQTEIAQGILETPPSAQSVSFFERVPAYNARVRTTCVATQLQAGHAENALPQRATATVNCRILPGVPPERVLQTLVSLVDDPQISFTPMNDPTPSPASPLTEEVMAPIQEITEDLWPGVAVIPTMSTGATDGLYFRNAGIPVYGVSGIFGDMNDVRAHGRDERILIESFFDGLEFLDRLVRAHTSE